MRPLFDTHCHLDFDDFAADRTKVVQRAFDAGVRAIMVPGTRAQPPLPLQYDGIQIFRAVGLHPYFIETHQVAQLEWVEAQLDQSPTRAVGEIGLDATCADFTLQMKLFDAQVALAAKYHRPVILHHRKTQPALLRVIKKYRDELPEHGGVLHAFSGSQEQALQWHELGFKLGVGGTITYSRAQKTRAAVAALPLEALVLETDAPDMPIAGQQGQRNEPAHIGTILKTLCELRKEDEATIRQQLWQSSDQLFGSASD